jgi:hypothetical protein
MLTVSFSPEGLAEKTHRGPAYFLLAGLAAGSLTLVCVSSSQSSLLLPVARGIGGTQTHSLHTLGMPDLLEACGKIESTNEDPLSYPSQDGLTGYVSRDEKLGGSPAIPSDFDDVTIGGAENDAFRD